MHFPQIVPSSPNFLRFDMIQLSTGVYMNYAEYGDTAGEPIILLHGFTDSWFSYSEVVKYLNPAFHVFIPDQRGHGASSEAASYRMAEMAEDVVAFIRAKGLENITLVGHSMGSFVAQRAALLAPEAVARLVLVGSAADAYTDDLAAFMEAINTLEDPVPEAFARDFQTSTLHRPVPREFLDRAVAGSQKVAAATWRLAGAAQVYPDTVPMLSQIKMPTLILWGECDTIWPYSEQEKLLHALPNAQLRVYPDTGHALHWEQPEQFARDLLVFIAHTPA